MSTAVTLMRVAVCALLASCAAITTTTTQDGAPPSEGGVSRDIHQDTRLPDDGVDSSDAIDADAAVDVSIDESAVTDVPPLPPRPVGTSCAADGGAPAEHCREVRLGGPLEFVMGSTQASLLLMERMTRQMPMPPFLIRPMRECDRARVRLRPGWLDAHEVSVARFRAWVQAGRPMPRNASGPGTSALHVWSEPASQAASAGIGFFCCGDKYITRVTFRGEDLSYDQSRCTWTDSPGPNESRPMTCVSAIMARAFCLWDGRHLATHALYEYVARAAGATETVTGGVPSLDAICGLEGVGLMPTRGASRCPPSAYPSPLGTHQQTRSREPTAGVADLVGNVSEFVSASAAHTGSVNLCPMYPEVLNEGTYEVGTYVVGLNYHTLDLEAPSLAHPGSRVTFNGNSVRSPRVGFRCARWVDEPP